jgi:hypothetical protein
MQAFGYGNEENVGKVSQLGSCLDFRFNLARRRPFVNAEFLGRSCL